jgi:hypothetical protein
MAAVVVVVAVTLVVAVEMAHLTAAVAAAYTLSTRMY